MNTSGANMQIIENWRRKSVDGLSADYLVYSILGYAAYTVYTAALYWSPGVQAAYITAHAGSAPDVCLADFLFAAHATLMSSVTLYQCYLYSSSNSSSSAGTDSSLLVNNSQAATTHVLAMSRTCQLTALGVVGAIIAYASHIGSTCGIDDCDAWLPLLLLLGITKVMMTLIKYTPQVRVCSNSSSSTKSSRTNCLSTIRTGTKPWQLALHDHSHAGWHVCCGLYSGKLFMNLSSLAIG